MDGFVAQLNRASDYGSEGSGFESQRSHNKREVQFRASLFFVCVNFAHVSFFFPSIESSLTLHLILLNQEKWRISSREKGHLAVLSSLFHRLITFILQTGGG